MISISGGSSVGYLTGGVGAGREGYYSGAVDLGEAPGRWNGKGAQRLGLVGEVDADVMAAVYGEFRDPRDPAFADPETRSASALLGRAPTSYLTVDQVVSRDLAAFRAENGYSPSAEVIQGWRVAAECSRRQAQAFKDLTYSPPKSVTVLHTALLRAGRLDEAARVVEILHEANGAALAYVEDHAYVRRGSVSAGTVTWHKVEGLTVATFQQSTSRNNDPQLHWHNAVLNRAEFDGRHTALDHIALAKSRRGASAVADRYAMAALSDEFGLSFEARADGHGFEVAGIAQDELDIVSTRSIRKSQRMADLMPEAVVANGGRPLNSRQLHRMAQWVTLETRPGKRHDTLNIPELLIKWDSDYQSLVVGGLLAIANRYPAGSTPPEADRFKVDLVVAMAVESLHEVAPTFDRHRLIEAIGTALPPHLGVAPEEGRRLLEWLADYALSDEVGLVVQVAGREIGNAPSALRREDGLPATMAPGAVQYSGAGHVAAEMALVGAAHERNRLSVPAAAVEAWLSEHGTELSESQAGVLLGLASSDAALTVLVGPAGTGKSFTVGKLAEAWWDLAQGRVLGLAVAESAAGVLRDDGLTASNLAAFLVAQERIASSRPMPGDAVWQLSARDVIVLDEASMVDTQDLTSLRQVVDAAGARLVLLGDPAQLGAVGAGGMMPAVIERGAEVYSLSEVRRFDEVWEGPASLRLRDGDAEVLAEYDRHGRLMAGGREADTIAASARAVAADILAGREAVLTVPTNDMAAAAASMVREHLLTAGVVSDDGALILGRGGTLAGVGDVVMARRGDRGLGVVNRLTYRVESTAVDGSMVVADTRTGRMVTLPAEYVEADLSLAYASTVHAAQGQTVDAAHVVVTSTTGREAAYVGMSRGRSSNLVWAVTDAGVDDVEPISARAVLAGVVTAERAESDVAAIDVLAADEATRTDVRLLMGLIEGETLRACRQRLADDLDALAAGGLLVPAALRALSADPGLEHLAQLLRGVELSGEDQRAALVEAVYASGMHRDTWQRWESVSPARALGEKLTEVQAIGAPVLDMPVPVAGIEAERSAYIGGLSMLVEDRQRALGSEAAESAPDWAVSALGEVPAEPLARLEWETKAGRIAAYRGVSGHAGDAAIGPAPGLSLPERRRLWHEAYRAAGRPEATRPEAELSTGQLLVRATAAERIKAHAPADVHDVQRSRQQEAAEAYRAAILAASQGDDVEAARLRVKAADAEAAAAALDEVALTRAEYLTRNAVTIEPGEAATRELVERRVGPAVPGSGVTAAEVLAEAKAQREAEDAWRPITEADVTQSAEPLAFSRPLRNPTLESGPAPVLPTTASAVEVEAASAHARQVVEVLADQASQDASEPPGEYVQVADVYEAEGSEVAAY